MYASSCAYNRLVERPIFVPELVAAAVEAAEAEEE
jgi:hypothetical protein